MENLSIEKFDPLKAEVTDLVENIKNTVVSIPEGADSYEVLKTNRGLLRDKRIELTKRFKDERAGALAFQKAVITVEKDLLAIMEPLEKEYSETIKKVDEEKAMERRRGNIPERLQRLEMIEIKREDVTDEFLLSMDDKQFLNFFNEKRQEYLDEKERKAKEEQRIKDEESQRVEEERIFTAKKKEEERLAKIKEEEDERRAKLEEEERERQAKIKAEEDERLARIDAENKKIEEEKQKIADEKKRIEDERIAKEQEEKRLADIEKAKKQAAEAESKRIEDARVAEEERVAKEKKDREEKATYQKFLEDNGYNEVDFHIIQDGKKTALYKKIAEIII